jgi:biotin transport system substrate-specific component
VGNTLDIKYIKQEGMAEMENERTKDSLFSVRSIALIGMMAALMAVISQISIPMPTGVPVTLQVFGLAFIGMMLGWKRGFCAIVIYILVGIAGAPVFANFGAGPARLVGPAGGYLMAWPVMVALCGIRFHMDNRKMRIFMTIVCGMVGLAAVEVFGGWWWSHVAQSDFGAIMIYSAAAFIPKDAVLTLLGLFFGDRVRKVLKASGHEI